MGDMDDDVVENLAHRCSRHPSIAAGCRRVGIDRRQFNQYLIGQSRPWRADMRGLRLLRRQRSREPAPAFRIAQSGQLRNRVSVRTRPVAEASLGAPMQHLDRLYQKSGSLERSAGYHFRYVFSFRNPGRIMKSLGRLYLLDGRACWKNVELVRADGRGSARAVAKYEGAAFFLTDRIYVVEYETLQANSLSQMTLYPSWHSRTRHRTGSRTGGPDRTRSACRTAAACVSLPKRSVRRCILRLEVP